MRSKISALVICKNRDDFSNVKTNFGDYFEDGFEIIVLKNDTNIIHILNSFKTVDCIITIGEPWQNYTELCDLGYEWRRKWVTFDTMPDDDTIAKSIINTFMQNLTKKNITEPLFSIITPVYNTPSDFINRLYSSLCNQTYKNWNWWVLDDSTEHNLVIEQLKMFNDARIFIFKNISHNGNVGFNKRILGMACDGDYIVEIDHDDEILPNCLETLKNAFSQYPDAGFAYSYTLELLSGNRDIDYGDKWACGQGQRNWYMVNDEPHYVMETPDINIISMKTIHAVPNHIRVWKKETYIDIDGHNKDMSIVDDYELIVRTFLSTKMIKIPQVLYIQHREHETTQTKRNREIQRTNLLVSSVYNELIDERVTYLTKNKKCPDEQGTIEKLNYRFN